jgi:hypothetical protein
VAFLASVADLLALSSLFFDSTLAVYGIFLFGASAAITSATASTIKNIRHLDIIITKAPLMMTTD